MDIVGSLKSAAVFIALLSVLVFVHEWGHFIVAKLCGMRVDDFSLFFGKRLIRLGVRNGTEYNIRSIPLGGFVKIAGMEPDDISNGAPIFKRRSAETTYAANTSQIYLTGLSEEALAEINFGRVDERVQRAVEQAINKYGKLTSEGKAELRSLLAAVPTTLDEHRYIEAVLAADAYEPDPNGYNQRPLWQRAAVIFAGPFMSLFFGYALFCVMGFTTGLPEPGKSTNVVDFVLKATPAAKAGIKPGDKIVQIDNQPIKDGNQMVEIIHRSIGTPLHVRLERDKSKEVSLVVTPYADDDPDGPKGKKIGRLGFQMRPEMTLTRYTPVKAIEHGTTFIQNYIKVTLTTLFSRHVRENIGGPVAIIVATHQARQEGPVAVLLMAAVLSISLGIMNLLPIPILDGGQLLLLGVEGVRRQKLSTREVYMAQLFGLSVIGVLFVLVMFNDIWRLIPHGK